MKDTIEASYKELIREIDSGASPERISERGSAFREVLYSRNRVHELKPGDIQKYQRLLNSIEHLKRTAAVVSQKRD